ncbi:hypothetical protein BT93_L2746 [Corymbia citriodora subsp. variegata]|uniref:Serine carboxypeptidase-like 45 n=1 Tax=Corymbia citriodora subsp. variegata TaxID=360336 RepID=A0A8T0CJB3_CORYI|nr:hypothetical protein BT93_L2746 [Corymbia citriodora subsp. variegata]
MSQPWLILTVITCSILMQACKPATSLSDRILSLPGQPSVNFSHYSDYITVGDHPPRALFYYFVEAETSPASKPLVLWLNGGPGCSSLGYGAFIEHGPFKVKGEGLVKNDYSWNKVANLLYLESPAGVGFSYSTNQSFYKGINDNITAQDNLVFLQRWFTKYPQYKGRDFFITGESHYVPEFARLIVKSKVEINLKAIAVNHILLVHGIISDQSELLFQNVCNRTQLLREFRANALTSECIYVVLKVAKELSDTKAIDHFLDTKDPCEEQDVIKYLNRRDVQIALHAKLVGVRHWNSCSEYEDLYISMIPILGELVKSGLRAIVYSGDLDAVIPFLGTRTMVDALATEVLKLNTNLSYRAWFTGKQVAGYTQEYGKLAFATIRGASHTVPATQPERSLQLFTSFLMGKSLPTEA